VLLAGLVTVIFLSAWVRLNQSAAHGPYGQPAADTYLGELLAGQCLGQTFVADAPGLYRVDVLLETYQRTNHGPLLLHVRAAPFAPDWATASIDMADLSDNAYQAFQFPPLALPAGVPAFFCLEAPAAAAGNAVAVAAYRQETYSAGQALWPDGQPIGQARDLTFRLFYRPSAGWTIAAGLERLAAGKPGWLGRPQFYFLLFGLYVVLVVASAWRLGGWLARPWVAAAERARARRDKSAVAADEPAASAR
jgi:hypothetical protein